MVSYSRDDIYVRWFSFTFIIFSCFWFKIFSDGVFLPFSLPSRLLSTLPYARQCSALFCPALFCSTLFDRYEITEVAPDSHMMDAMNKQAAAERGKSPTQSLQITDLITVNEAHFYHHFLWFISYLSCVVLSYLSTFIITIVTFLSDVNFPSYVFLDTK